jgi:hypothetical protein
LNTFANVMKSLRYRYSLHYDLSWRMWTSSFRYLIYIFSRVLGKPNNRIDISMIIAKEFVEKFTSVNSLRTVNLIAPKEENPIDVAANCFERYGFYPISFVLMRDTDINQSFPDKTKLISHVIPGNSYSFDNESELYREYRNSEFAFTFKKCGWDSYRNLEIISQKAFPLYLDVKSIPRFSMTFYPKKQIQQVTELFLESPVRLSEDFRQNFFHSALSVLNTQFLAQYLISCVRSEPRSVLFYDESLDLFKGDYQSMMILKSLTKIPNIELTLVQKLDYLFFSGVDKSDLYGRGFGYVGLLEDVEVYRKEDFKITDIETFDWIVVGSAARNLKFILSLNSRLRDKIILIWGEDRSPTRSELKLLQSKSQHIFVREIHHPFVVP